MNDQPLVSIGMPVYDGERFIEETIESLLAQTYRNYEIIISDNASSDRTREIVAEYIQLHSNISLQSNNHNVGAIRNFQRVFDLANGKYFMWASDHDLWRADCIERYVNVLEADRTIALVYSLTTLIDDAGAIIGEHSARLDTCGQSALKRFEMILWRLGYCNAVYGLFRRSILSRIRLREIWGPDNLLLAEINLYGSMALIEEGLYFRRMNRQDETSEQHRSRILEDLFPGDDEKAIMSRKALMRQLRGAHLDVVLKAPLPIRERLQGAISVYDSFRHASCEMTSTDKVIVRLFSVLGRTSGLS